MLAWGSTVNRASLGYWGEGVYEIYTFVSGFTKKYCIDIAVRT
jgi:hypothetical protein